MYEGVVVYYVRPYDWLRLEVGKVEQVVQRVRALVAPHSTRMLVIYVFPNSDELRKLAGGSGPRAFARDTGIFLSGPPISRRLVAHEAAHFFRRPASVPRWFDEGVAMYAQSVVEPSGLPGLAAGALDAYRRWRPALSREDGVGLIERAFAPRGSHDAYDLAYALVRYLVHEAGTEAAISEIVEMSQPRAFPVAVQEILGFSPDAQHGEMFARWRAFMESPEERAVLSTLQD